MAKATDYDGVQLLPSPEVGTMVRYYPADQDLGDFCAALVTKIESPGQVQVEVHSPNRQSFFKSGVHWVGDDRRMAPGRPFRANGCWDYIPVQKDPCALHRESLERRKEALRISQERAAAAKAAIAKEHEEKRSLTDR